MAVVLGTWGCSSVEKAPKSAETKEIDVLNSRISELEANLKATSDKLDAMQIMFENATGHRKPKTAGVQNHSADRGGSPVVPKLAKTDPEAGFIRDQAVQGYRRAVVLLEAGKTPEALLAFSGFLEKYPDHPLAGAAQYYVGKCYLAQKQYKQAIQEFQRVLTSYDRSSHVAHTLRDLAEAEDAQGNSEQAAKYRQMLGSLFPQSPAAAKVAANDVEPAAPPKRVEAPTEGGSEPAALDEPPAPTDNADDKGSKPE